MDKAAELLVIIVSIVLVVFLIISIVAVVKIVQVLQSLKRITAKAEKLTESAEAIGAFFQRTTNPVAVGKLLFNIAESVRHHDHNGKRESKKDE